MNKTKAQLIEEIKASSSKYVSYGDGDLSTPILKQDAIDDISTMDEEMIGDGEWYEVDENGNEI